MRAVWSWFVVTLVGIIVVGLVLGLGLFGRLDAGQQVLDDAGPLFTPDRVAGAAAGVGVVSAATDLLDPIVLRSGGAADEVGPLVSFVSAQTRKSPTEVLAALRTNFPHTLALLQTVPFEDVATELPRLVPFLATTLKLSPEAVTAALPGLFPGISQSITALPTVTAGWEKVPGTEGFTRFDGTPINSVRDVRDYFAQDVVPVLQRESKAFGSLASTGGVGFLPMLLLVTGLIVIVFGVMMMVLASKGMPKNLGTYAWSTVIAVGALVIVLVLALNLFPRLNAGSALLADVAPVLTAERVAGAKAGVEMISAIVDLADPVALETSAGTQEVPNVVAFIARQANIPPATVIPALAANGMPKIATLLQAVSLKQIAEEIPKLVTFLSGALNLPEDQVTAAIARNFPRLNQAITALPKVTDVWESVSVPGFTRVDGTPITTVPQVRDYFRNDVIPALERQQKNFQTLNNAWPPVSIFPPLLLAIGIIVIIYGFLMLALVRRGGPGSGSGPVSKPAHRALVNA